MTSETDSTSLDYAAVREFPAEEASFTITASDLLEFLFCPRFIYFENYLGIPEHQEKRYKVLKGRTIHEDTMRVNPDYLRKKIGCIERRKSVYLASVRGMRGIADEVLFLNDGTAAPLDYKYAEYKEHIFRNHKYQLAFYGQLIRENFHVPVSRGFIVYTRSNNKLVEVSITEQMYGELDKIILDLRGVVQRGLYPEPTKFRARCDDCCYRNICEKVI